MKAISHDFSLKEARPQPLVAGCLRGDHHLSFEHGEHGEQGEQGEQWPGVGGQEERRGRGGQGVQ